jgi:hypothetical protein
MPPYIRHFADTPGGITDMLVRTLWGRAATTVLVGLLATLAVAAPAAAHSSSTRSDSNTATAEATATGATAGDAAAVAAAKKAGISPNAESDFCFAGQFPLDCWVFEPIVNRPSASYPNIQFFPGAHVFVDAGGCVQTGGHGKTWKRYVNPSSDNGLYHGLMFIPGVTNGLQPLWTLVGRTFVTPAGGALELGYEDDGYSDNGYYSHDDGTGDQCKNVGNAWVHLIIS